jgi:hypothetical protein
MPQFRIYTRTESGEIAGVNDIAPSALGALADRRFLQARRPESRRSFAAEPVPDPCPTGDYAFNAERVKLILAGQVPGAVWFNGNVFRTTEEDAPAPAPTCDAPAAATPGPRRPLPAVPVEVHNKTPFDANRAWEATRIASLGRF